MATTAHAPSSPSTADALRPLAVPVGLVALVIVAMVVAPSRVPAGVVAQGVIFGGGTGLLAVGLVLTYRSHRIVNFAFGAMGGLAASVGVALFLGTWGLPWPVCVLLSLLLGGVIGVCVERIVIRRFAKASRLTLTMATIGLAQVLGGMELLVPIIFNSRPLVGSFETPLNVVKVPIDPVVVTGNDLLLLAVVPLLLGALTWFLLKTEPGIAIRGIADNGERARLLGIPVDRLSTLVWCISGVTAAITVVLKSPTEGLVLDAAAGPQLLLPALAAAVVAGMTDLPKAFAAGVALGVLDQVVRWNVDKQSITSLVFLAVILVALLVKKNVGGRVSESDSVWSTSPGQRMPAALARLPQVRIPRWVGAVALGIGMVVLPLLATSSQLNRVDTAMVFGVLAISVVVLTGWSGSVSLGQFAIAGLGGVVAANLIGRTGVDLFIGLIAAAGVGALVAVVVGLPALRVTGLFLAVTTLAFAVAVDSFLLNPVNFKEQIPGSYSRPVLFGHFDGQSESVLYYLCLGVLVATVVVVVGLRRGRTGRIWVATRDNPRAAAAAGVSTTRTRLGAFVVSGMMAGVAGAVYAMVLGGLGYHTFEPASSVLVFSMAVIGGMASVGGALLGVVLVSVVAYVIPQYQLIITGAGALLVLLGVPQGLVQVVRNAEIRIQTAIARRRGVDLAALVDTDDVAPPAAVKAADRPTVDVPAAAVAGTVALDCRDVTASYGPMQVLFGVDLVVEQGEMVALLGTNGAGKSTLLRSVTGLLPPDDGRIELAAAPGADDPRPVDLSRVGPEQIARKGVSLMPGGRGLFPSLTVAENLRLAAWLRRKERDAVATVRDESLALMPKLADRMSVRAGDLSGGEQQMLSLAMALAPRPRVLCIDELSLGLAPTVVGDLVEHVRRIHQQGTTVVIVEQSVNVALLLADRAVFLEKGRVTYEGPTRELLERPEVLRSVFVGKAVAEQPPADAARERRPDRGVALDCKGLTKRYGGVTAVDDVDLRLEPGSIVGIIGHNGAGKTTLVDLVSGFTRSDGGRVVLGDVDVTGEPAHRRAVAGLGRSFQEARLFPSLTVRETVMVALDRHLANRDPIAAALWLPAGKVSEDTALERVDALLDLLGLTRYANHLTGELSTGTRRIVELACILAQDPAVVVLDEPSAGVAQRETEALGPLLRRVQERTGCSMLVIEHDMALLSGLCDELVAMELGRVITRGTPAEVLVHPQVVASYLGTDDAVIHRSGTGPAAAGAGAPGTEPAGATAVAVEPGPAPTDDR
ncbi:MAG: ATP-binding cassette domain-containing protein [Acidimicrobiales bacterium]